MPGRVLAIGDIHGCARALATLVEAIAPQSDDLVIPLGDVIDRGPATRSVIDQLIGLRQRCQLRPILGNHEEMMLSVLLQQAAPHAWIRCGGAATLNSYGFAGDLSVIPAEHIEFLISFADTFETATHFFVHANYDPQRDLAKQSSRTTRWLSLDMALPGPHMSGKVAVVGHTPDLSGEIFSLRHLKCIDTYCHGGGWLTALDVMTGVIWQANDQGELR